MATLIPIHNWKQGLEDRGEDSSRGRVQDDDLFDNASGPYVSVTYGLHITYFHRCLFCCCYSVAKLCLTLCYPMNCTTHQTSMCFTISLSLLKLMSIGSVMPTNHLILCRPLLLPSVFPSIRVFSNELAVCIRWPQY